MTLLQNLFQAGHEFREKDNVLKNKYFALVSISLFLASFLLIMVPIRLFQGNLLQMTVDVVFLIAILGLNYYLRLDVKNFTLVSRAILGSAFIAAFSVTITTPESQTRYLWFIFLLVITYLLRDRKEGLIWTGMTLLALIAIDLFSLDGIDRGIDALILFTNVIIVSLAMHRYEEIKEGDTKKLVALERTTKERDSLIEHLEYLSSFDTMTGIYNRRKFFELAAQMWQEKSDEGLYAVMIDLDHFKHINDTYGHPFGDEVLRQIVHTIQENIGEDVLYARMGGEEFALLYDAKLDGTIAQRLAAAQKAVEDLRITNERGEAVSCTISQGVAKSSVEINSLDALLKEADNALYEAKGRGRNRIIFRGQNL
jgi:diguanylate cyclase (GGDEF)-like protein